LKKKKKKKRKRKKRKKRKMENILKVALSRLAIRVDEISISIFQQRYQIVRCLTYIQSQRLSLQLNLRLLQQRPFPTR